ncbi:hypothetical protein BX600DRAFT_435191 [Xylariales sp. PMI_506]|nr:hypothetical protein BX600DRAFT_435191 [Xylariales sp. PMI_506]
MSPKHVEFWRYPHSFSSTTFQFYDPPYEASNRLHPLAPLHLQTDEINKIDEISVYQVHAGDGDGADVVFVFNGQRIAVSIFPSSPAPHNDNLDREQACCEDHLIDLLGRAASAEIDDDEYEEILQPPSQDLHTLLYPGTLNFRLKTAGDKAAIVPIDPDEAYTCLEASFDYNTKGRFEIDRSLPQYLPEQILILETFFGLFESDVEQELASLQKIQKACLHHPTSIRVPEVLGYAKHSESGCMLGFLREWLPGRRLRDIDIPMISKSSKEKWASQIRETIKQLHEIEVIWGDGKAGNVIIDEEGNAWLIDFGGGFTEGWVEEELAGTLEGDEQAVKKIMEFLNI